MPMPALKVNRRYCESAVDDVTPTPAPSRVNTTSEVSPNAHGDKSEAATLAPNDDLDRFATKEQANSVGQRMVQSLSQQTH